MLSNIEFIKVLVKKSVYKFSINFIGGNMISEMLETNSNNPISDLINDETYTLLNSLGLINEKMVRDYLIRQEFKNMRKRKVKASAAIDSLRSEYPYLQFDTIRKIVYQTN